MGVVRLTYIKSKNIFFLLFVRKRSWQKTGSGVKHHTGLGVMLFHRYRCWKDFLYVCVSVRMYVCMYVCEHPLGWNFYPIATLFGTQIGLLKSEIKFEDELCNSYRGRITFPQGFIDLTNVVISI